LWSVAGLLGALATIIALLPNTVAGGNSIDMVKSLQPPTASAFFILALSAVIAGWWIAKRDLQRGVAILGCGAVLGYSVLIYGADALGNTRSAKTLADQLKPQLTADTTLYSYYDYEQTLPFYLARTMSLVQYKGELEFGLSQEPHLWVADSDAFIKRWVQDAHPIAIIEPKRYNALRETLPMKIIAQQSNLLAVTKPDQSVATTP